ncbi:MAG: hypothetical protein ACTSWG_11130 [Candidatus Helarchaeota archaeon]
MIIESNNGKKLNKIMKSETSETFLELVKFYKYYYDYEEKRQDTLENKASLVLGFSGIISSIITGVWLNSYIFENILMLIIFLISITFFIIGGISALLTLKLRKYNSPFILINAKQIEYWLNTEVNELRSEIIKNFSDSLINNWEINNKKLKWLTIALLGITIGIVFLFIMAILFAFI